jgi:hypothetical protein
VSHFSRCFSRHFKVAPRDVRQTPVSAPQPKSPPRVALRNGFGSPYWEIDKQPVHETA